MDPRNLVIYSIGYNTKQILNFFKLAFLSNKLETRKEFATKVSKLIEFLKTSHNLL
jgi:hypothetical protein